MGLAEDIQNDLLEAFNGDLSDAYKMFTVEKITSSTYDPNTGQTINAVETGSAKGVILKDKSGSVLDEEESISDLRLLILDVDKPFDFELEQKIIYNSTEYKIIGIIKDPVIATWTLDCIFWN